MRILVASAFRRKIRYREMLRHSLVQQIDQCGLQEDELVWNLETQNALQRGMRGKHAPQRLDLHRIHREDDVGPLEHAHVDADQRIFFRASGPHIKIVALAENTLGGGAAVAIQTADEENAFGRYRLGHREFQVILMTSPAYRQ